MSQEHLISECLFDGNINVMGLPWCKDAHKTIRIETLTDNILCRRHNGALSAVDNAAKHTLDTIGEAVELYETRKVIQSRSWTIKYFETDMLLLERWCLKTLINIRMNSRPDYPIEGDWSELVRVAFGLEKFTPPKGLYMMAIQGHNLNFASGRITITTQTMNDKLAGAKFELRGMPFFLNLVPEPIQVNHGKGHLLGHGMKQWFSTRDNKGRMVKSHLMTFTYPKD
jgi:hypothetical protein